MATITAMLITPTTTTLTSTIARRMQIVTSSTGNAMTQTTNETTIIDAIGTTATGQC